MSMIPSAQERYTYRQHRAITRSRGHGHIWEAVLPTMVSAYDRVDRARADKLRRQRREAHEYAAGRPKVKTGKRQNAAHLVWAQIMPPRSFTSLQGRANAFLHALSQFYRRFKPLDLVSAMQARR